MGLTLGSFLVYGVTLDPYLTQFDVEKLEMASVMGICAGLVGPKSENVEKVLFFNGFLRCQEGREDASRTNDRAARSTFWSLWGRFLVYEGDFGSLWDHFGATMR